MQRNKNMIFTNTDGKNIGIKARWFTNLNVNYDFIQLNLTKQYKIGEYPKFDNYNAINVDKTVDIPINYDGLMGVPVSFLDYYNPEQFEIVDAIARYSLIDKESVKRKKYLSKVDGKNKFSRIIIKRI